jgi:predicted RNase H-like nuclease (RuvC/YqgF family)
VEDLTKELAETKDRLVTAQTIDLEVHTRENTQREQLQAELTQERQTIANLQAEVNRMKAKLEEVQ